MEAQCSTVDFCLRTITKSVAMCRTLSVILVYPMTATRGFGDLMTFFESAPRAMLDAALVKGSDTGANQSDSISR